MFIRVSVLLLMQQMCFICCSFIMLSQRPNPGLSNVFYEISTQEMRHVNMLHEEVVKLIKTHREKHGEPPTAMMAVYEWEHNRQIERTQKIKILQNQFRDGM